LKDIKQRMDRGKSQLALLALGVTAIALTLSGLYYTYGTTTTESGANSSGTGDKEDTEGKKADDVDIPNASEVEEIKVDDSEKADGDQQEWESITDPNHDGNRFLTKKEAAFRSQIVSDVHYTIALGLLKGGKTFNGKIKIEFKLSAIQERDFEDGQDNSQCLFIDYKGNLIRHIVVNGKALGKDTPNLWNNHRIYIPKANQKEGKNSVSVEFESKYVNDCQGFQHYQDPGDNEEYVYTELEPDYCHICYPCFD
jgi:hypothetical protein